MTKLSPTQQATLDRLDAGEHIYISCHRSSGPLGDRAKWSSTEETVSMATVNALFDKRLVRIKRGGSWQGYHIIPERYHERFENRDTKRSTHVI